MNRSSSMEQNTPSNGGALARAIARVLGAVEEADGNALSAKPGAVKVTIKAGQGTDPECKACKDGTCTDPDHASEEMESMAAEMGEE